MEPGKAARFSTMRWPRFQGLPGAELSRHQCIRSRPSRTTASKFLWPAPKSLCTRLLNSRRMLRLQRLTRSKKDHVLGSYAPRHPIAESAERFYLNLQLSCIRLIVIKHGFRVWISPVQNKKSTSRQQHVFDGFISSGELVA